MLRKRKGINDPKIQEALALTYAKTIAKRMAEQRTVGDEMPAYDAVEEDMSMIVSLYKQVVEYLDEAIKDSQVDTDKRKGKKRKK